MSNAKLTRFANEKYLNLESYRKTGAAVATPVWFAQNDDEHGDELYIYSLAEAGKVKRIRNNPRVRVMPCDFRGGPKGEWVDATARIIDGAEADKAQRLLDKKYGLMKRIGNIFSRIMKRPRAAIAIHLD
jgi:PPOX class probable F420-dependent enzyme